MLSRRQQFQMMKHGDEVVFMVDANQGSKLMLSNHASFCRLDLNVDISQSLWIAVCPKTRQTKDIVLVTAKAKHSKHED